MLSAPGAAGLQQRRQPAPGRRLAQCAWRVRERSCTPSQACPAPSTVLELLTAPKFSSDCLQEHDLKVARSHVLHLSQLPAISLGWMDMRVAFLARCRLASGAGPGHGGTAPVADDAAGGRHRAAHADAWHGGLLLPSSRACASLLLTMIVTAQTIVRRHCSLANVRPDCCIS